MGTGWRRAFCTTVPRDPETTISSSEKHQTSPGDDNNSSPTSQRSCTKLSFFSSDGTSNPNTPRLQNLRCRTTTNATAAAVAAAAAAAVPTTNLIHDMTPKSTKSPKPNRLISSTPSSPRSPLKLGLFRNSFKLRTSCGICFNSVKTGQGTAIYTAECAHTFHFPCIASHVRTHGTLICPVCSAAWKDAPLLAIKNNQNEAEEGNKPSPKLEEKKIVIIEESSPSPRLVRIVTPPQQRAYDDDEPLLSPTAGARFVAIPEADENANEDDAVEEAEEFQGFFVNSSVKSDELQPTNSLDSCNVQVRLLPEAAIVSGGRGFETYVVALRVKAPPPSTGKNTAAPLSNRAPIDLVTVFDLSGSMAGPKLFMMKRAMRLVISSLGPADRLSMVAFSANHKRLMPLRRMTAQGQRAARRIVDRLVCGQGNCVGDALRKATRVLEDRRERNPVASIMLLSDGQSESVQSNSNQNQRSQASHVSSTRFAHIEIPVHSFGFGKRGGYSNEPAEDSFAKCVGGLLSVVVQDLRIQLGLAPGSALAEIAAVYSCSTKPSALSTGSVRLGDLYAEEERELLVELRVPSADVGDRHLMSVRCLYKDPATQEVVYGRDQVLLVPRPQALRSSAPKIQRLGSLFITTRAIAEAKRLVEHNDFSSAHHLIVSSRALLLQSSTMDSGGDENVKSLEAELAEIHWRRQQVMEREQNQNQNKTTTGMMNQRRRGSERDGSQMSTATVVTDENGEPLTPTSAWRAAEKLAKMAIMKKSLNRVSDLHGFENARF